MHPLRAASFVSTGRAPWRIDPHWPRLPADLTLDRVSGIGIDSRGFLLVAHRGERPLLRLLPDGRLHSEIGAEHQRNTTAYDLRGPKPIPIATRYWLHGLHVDPWDNVWVTDVSRHLVMKFNPAGALVMTLGVDGESGCDDRHFYQPTHVCVLPSGEFFVTDGYGNSRVIKFNARGERLLEWGQRGTAPGEFHTPHVIVLGHDGRLYVSDRENDRVQVFDTDGRVVAVWPDLHSVDGLYSGPDGALYGSAGIDNAVLRFGPDGTPAECWADGDALRYPHALAVEADGAIYTAESGDVWIVTGREPAERHLVPRSGPEGSRIQKLLPV